MHGCGIGYWATVTARGKKNKSLTALAHWSVTQSSRRGTGWRGLLDLNRSDGWWPSSPRDRLEGGSIVLRRGKFWSSPWRRSEGSESTCSCEGEVGDRPRLVFLPMAACGGRG